MNYWIFQSKPERYDLREKLVPGKKESWIATRYRTRMNPEDIVFFWMAGDERIRGVYGWGRISSKPHRTDRGFRVDVEYRRKLRDFLPATLLREKTALQNMMIFNLPLGTNFYINRDEGKAIVQLMPADERPQGVDGNAKSE
jgi:predicted RNA-binding protein with PUA-like domain